MEVSTTHLTKLPRHSLASLAETTAVADSPVGAAVTVKGLCLACIAVGRGASEDGCLVGGDSGGGQGGSGDSDED